MSAHRKPVKLSGELPTAMSVNSREIVLNTGFVGAVKVVYLNGNLHEGPTDGIISAVGAALKARAVRRPLVSWDDAAINVALRYLEGRGDIVLPPEKDAAAQRSLAGVA